MMQSSPSDPRELFQQVTGSLWDNCDTKIEVHDRKVVSLANELHLYRLMLAQLRSADPESRNTLSRNLTLLIIRESGLRKLLTATFDFDETSQHVTTLDQRFQAMAHLIAAPPVISCPLIQYYERISAQIHSLMKHDASLTDAVSISVCKVCTMTVNVMIARKRKLAQQTFIQPLISSLSGPGGALTPQNCIEIICGLALADFDLRILLETFPALLFARCLVEPSSPVFKPRLTLALTEFVKRVDNSVYMLDDSLFNHYETSSKRYHITTGTSEQVSIVFSEDNNEKADKLKTVDNMVCTTMMLICEGFSEEQQVDFCLLLLERLSGRHLMSPDCAFLLYSLVATLMEKIESLLCKFPRKWIRFIGETLNRLSYDGESKASVKSASAGSVAAADAASVLRKDSMTVVMQILRILVSERSRVSVLMFRINLLTLTLPLS